MTDRTFKVKLSSGAASDSYRISIDTDTETDKTATHAISGTVVESYTGTDLLAGTKILVPNTTTKVTIKNTTCGATRSKDIPT